MLELGKLVNVVPEVGAKLCAVCFTDVKDVCKCNDAEALDIIAKRWANNDVSATFAEALLDIDEAAQVVDKADVMFLQAEQGRECTNKEDMEDFANDFRSSRARHRAAQPAPRADRGQRPPPR